MYRAKIGACIAVAALSAAPSYAGPITDGSNVFIFGGRFQDEWVWETAAFWRPHYEDNYFVGAGYQTFVADLPANFHFGLELGVGMRVGQEASAEIWTGVVLKNDGVTIGDVTISPAITGGISMVSDTIGVEKERAGWIDRNVPVLFYMGPEIAVSHADFPDLEMFARIHHRSGGYGVIAEIDGSNAATLGLRFKL
ncbi:MULTISPECIES: hypothetical protein [unclassified Devosia]|uniref:hypothetical protein n=1 Tax=unclassified Devosia TaxID=196773 RepID=UPI001552CE49|nr:MULTISPECIES: hypothetical protein [unclassified Devosia]